MTSLDDLDFALGVHSTISEPQQGGRQDEIDEHSTDRGEGDQEAKTLNVGDGGETEGEEADSEDDRGAHHRSPSMFKGVADGVFYVAVLVKMSPKVM